MSDDLADRLNNVAQEHAQRKQAEIDQRNNADRVNAFISDHAREEYGNMVRLLKERAEEMNSINGNLPQFVVGGEKHITKTNAGGRRLHCGRHSRRHRIAT